MRRKIELYINDVLADIATDALVLMNYKQTDASAPAAVYNSWSQSVALPRTSKNNAIFDHIFRADHVTTSGKFNALVRTPFTIYNEQGEILESGYLKLTDITETQYSATLYGGLGGFLFGLMYNADGSKRSLADLVYTSGGDSHEFDFKITRDAVREAWRHIDELEAHATPWDYINFAPCYNGLPGGDFDSKKGFCSTNCYGVTGDDGAGHRSRNGHVLVDLVDNVDEWAANDLRSYQQRPVVRFKAILDAICNSANNGGYSVTLDSSFFSGSNPYYQKTWLTLPKLDEIQLPTESGSGTNSIGAPATGALPAYDDTHVKDIVVPGPWQTDARRTTKHDISVTFYPAVGIGFDYEPRLGSWQTGSGGTYIQHRLVVLYQLVAYDADGLVVGASKVAATTTRPKGSGVILEETVTPRDFVGKYNLALGTRHNVYYPEYFTDMDEAYDSQMYNGDLYHYSDSGDMTPKVLATSGGTPIPVTLQATDLHDVHRVEIRVTYLAASTQSGDAGQYHQELITALPYYATPTAAGETLTDVNIYDGSVTYAYEAGGTVHSGAQITKALLLGGTQTPADYLLSYLKTFGLYMTYNPATKAVGIMTRGSFYNGSDIDLTEKIDLPSRRSVPYAVASRWYEWVAAVSGRFADYYKDVYNRTYGMARVNTGFEFDASHNDVLKDCIFKGAAEVLHRNKYFVRVTQNSKGVPSPFLDGGKYTLWGGDESAAQLDIVCPDDTATIEYVNTNYPGYDYGLLPKPEFCDKDGKAVSGEDVLLLFDGYLATSLYSRMTLTDDNGLMTLYNEGAPCYLLGQWTIPTNKKYTINYDEDDSIKLYMPRFRRFMTALSNPMVATHALDMAIPAEIDQPAITCAADKAVYQRAWASYITDKMDVDAKVMTCKVDLRGLQVGQDLLRNFYHFDGCIWVLNQIKNYVVGGDGLTECEFIKVIDKTNYTNGQNY